MTTIARLRRQRQRERRHTFRDSDVLFLSLFLVVPPLAALVAYVIGSIPFRLLRQWRGMSITLTIEWAKPTSARVRRRSERQPVPVAFYRAFQAEGER